MQRRKYGEGEMRLGFPIEIAPDIYSLAFVSMLKNEHIINFIDVLTGKLTSGKDESHVSTENEVTKALQGMAEANQSTTY